MTLRHRAYHLLRLRSLQLEIHLLKNIHWLRHFCAGVHRPIGREIGGILCSGTQARLEHSKDSCTIHLQATNSTSSFSGYLSLVPRAGVKMCTGQGFRGGSCLECRYLIHWICAPRLLLASSNGVQRVKL
ncbi:hypothetical protein M758_4G043100 [Ceratodon purpureus]|nr:hypothetical protein M758_4G043100 [Ceratodon purpureus]